MIACVCTTNVGLGIEHRVMYTDIMRIFDDVMQCFAVDFWLFLNIRYSKKKSRIRLEIEMTRYKQHETAPGLGKHEQYIIPVKCMHGS